MAEIVYTSNNHTDEARGTLFKGLKFWLSQKVPQRSRFIDDIRVRDSNGGIVVPLEKQAEIRLVDHARKEQLPETYSYTFIEASIRSGALEDFADHAVGPRRGTVRTMGSITRPAKATRRKFTATDDQTVWDWVDENPQKGGGTDGNEIYKQLETIHSGHTWQSWRDRYVRKLKGRPRPYVNPQIAPPTPPSEYHPEDEHEVEAEEEPEVVDKAEVGFDEEDAQALMHVGESIEQVPPEKQDEAWSAWAKEYGNKSDSTGNSSVSAMPQEVHLPSAEIRNAPTSIQRNQPQVLGDVIGSQDVYAQTSDSLQPSRESRETSSRPKIPHNTVLPAPPSISLSPRKGNSVLLRDLPPSSPPEAVRSPKRIRIEEPSMRREIPSTPPDEGKSNQPTNQHSPLFFESDDHYETARETDLHQRGSPLEEDLERIDEDPYAGDLSDASLDSEQFQSDTQTFLKEPTPYIDFHVPSPDEGWGTPELPDVEIKDEPDIEDSQHRISVPPDTQTLLNGETQIPDFAVPEPDGGWTSIAPALGSDLPEQRQEQQQAESVTSSGDTGAQLDDWIELWVAKGFPEEHVEAVLKSTSLENQLAGQVLESMRKGKRKSRNNDTFAIPDDWRGVWTGEDDDDLYATDARIIGRLQEKHGKASLKCRWEFLEYY